MWIFVNGLVSGPTNILALNARIRKGRAYMAKTVPITLKCCHKLLVIST